MQRRAWSIDDTIDCLCHPYYAATYLVLLLGWKCTLTGGPTSLHLLDVPALWAAAVVARHTIQRFQKPAIDWNEQVAVVTGSSGGLGVAVVSELKTRGCRVAAVDIVDQLPSSDVEDDSKYFYIQADVSRREEVYALPAAIRARFGQDATIVISNAGIMIGKLVLDFEEDEFERTIAVNLLATYHAVKAFLPSMLVSGRGHIVATSSVMGYISISQLTDYVASKHALVGFMESLRFELDKKYKMPGICTTLLILGKLSTPLFARTSIPPLSQFLQPTQDPKEVARALVDHLQRGRSGRIFLPYLAYFAPLLKAMPDWIRNAVQRASGADEALQPATRSDEIEGKGGV